jgi:hypothetical protein
VIVTATNDAGSTTAPAGPTGVVAAVAPDAAEAPSIGGTPRDGATLTADPGRWSGTTPIDLTYQWRRCDGGGQGCADIPGATAQTYAATAADVAQTVRVVVTATNIAGLARATSGATPAVEAVAPSVAARPTISGPARDGETLTADPGTRDGTQPMTFAYQWRRCDEDGTRCADVPGASDPTYTPGNDVGGTMRVVVAGPQRGRVAHRAVGRERRGRRCAAGDRDAAEHRRDRPRRRNAHRRSRPLGRYRSGRLRLPRGAL